MHQLKQSFFERSISFQQKQLTLLTHEVKKTTDSILKHLPNLSLPKFSGDQLERESFQNLFQAMVDQTKLTDV